MVTVGPHRRRPPGGRAPRVALSCAVAVFGFVAWPASASAFFDVTDERTGQTFGAEGYQNTPYSCEVTCAFTFTGRTGGCQGQSSQHQWSVFDSANTRIHSQSGRGPWRYEFPAPGDFLVTYSVSTGQCGQGGRFRLRALDTTPPPLVLSGPTRQSVRSKRVVVVGRLGEVGSMTTSGRVSFPGKARVFRLVGTTVNVPAATPTQLALRIPRRALAPIRRALKRRKRAYANITVSGTDAAGNTSVAQRRVRLVR
jgi:hypothetical protein